MTEPTDGEPTFDPKRQNEPGRITQKKNQSRDDSIQKGKSRRHRDPFPFRTGMILMEAVGSVHFDPNVRGTLRRPPTQQGQITDQIFATLGFLIATILNRSARTILRLDSFAQGRTFETEKSRGFFPAA